MNIPVSLMLKNNFIKQNLTESVSGTTDDHQKLISMFTVANFTVHSKT